MRLLSFDDLPSKGVPYSRPHLYRLIKMGKFPRPVKLGENRVAFVEAEIDSYIESKIAERDHEVAA